MKGRAALAGLGLALAGCGDGGTTAADARLADVGLDAAPGPITVTVMRAIDFVGEIGGPAVGAPVFFVEADGTTTRVVTDADGRASAVIGPGATVYAQQPSDAGLVRVVAVTGLEPGLDVAIESYRFPSFSPPSVGTAQITLPSVPGAAFYQATVSCGDFVAGSGSPFLTPLVHACARLDHATVLTEALDVSSQVIAYGVAHDVDLRTTFDAPREVAADRAPARSLTTFTSVPPEVSSIKIRRLQHDGDVTAVTEVEPRRPEGSVVAFDLPVSAIGDRSELLTILTGTSAAVGLVHHNQRFDRPAPPVTVDLGASMLPFLTRPSVNLSARAAAWTYVGTGRRPDLIAMRATYSQTDFRSLTVIGPGDRTHFELPAFPDELAGVLPLPDEVPSAVDYVAVDVVGAGFRELVPTAFASFTAAYANQAYRQYDDVWLSSNVISAAR